MTVGRQRLPALGLFTRPLRRSRGLHHGIHGRGCTAAAVAALQRGSVGPWMRADVLAVAMEATSCRDPTLTRPWRTCWTATVPSVGGTGVVQGRLAAWVVSVGVVAGAPAVLAAAAEASMLEARTGGSRC